MSGTSWLDWRAPETAGRRTTSLEDRAATALTIVALLSVPGVLVAPWGGPPAWLLDLTSVGATVGMIALYLVTARGIRGRRAWALVALRPLLAVVVVFGIYSMIVAAQQGWTKVPVDAALATWAWLGRPEGRAGRSAPVGSAPLGSAPVASAPMVLRGVAARATSVVVIVIVLQAVVWYGPPVFGWGGLLDAHQRDFSAALHVDCGAPGSLPASVAVTYDWAWSVRPPMPSGLDMVIIGWRGSDGLGRFLYLLGSTPDSGPGIQDGLQAFPDTDMAEQVEAGTPESWHWGIHLDRQAYAPGRIQVRLQLANASPPRPEPVTVTATYIHLGLWQQSTAPVTCSW